MDTLIIVLIIFGALTGAVLVFGITITILWNRRKLLFTNFLNEGGKWIRVSHKAIDSTFDYNGCTYEFDIKKCTRDTHNRPVAHYYLNNPSQLIYNYEDRKKTINVGNAELSGKEFRAILLTKVIRDIFTEDDMTMWFIIILIVIIIGFLATIILMMTHNAPVVLKEDNETIRIIAEGVKLAIKGAGA